MLEGLVAETGPVSIKHKASEDDELELKKLQRASKSLMARNSFTNAMRPGDKVAPHSMNVVDVDP